MTDPKSVAYPSQVIVIVTIVGVDDKSQAFYTYTDDQLSHVHLEEWQSHVRAVIPYHTLYALDYSSSRNGWRFEKDIIHVSGPKITKHRRTDNKMGMITVHDDDEVHRFKLKFHNRATKGHFHDDPQEANVKQPT